MTQKKFYFEYRPISAISAEMVFEDIEKKRKEKRKWGNEEKIHLR